MSDYFANIDMMQAWTVLITGFVVVFSVLILLIVTIKIYSSIVYNIQNKPKNEKKNDDNDTTKGEAVTAAPAQTASNGIPNDILAAIAAAVEFMFGSKNVRIKNIKKSKSRSAWGSAGVKTNTRPF